MKRWGKKKRIPEFENLYTVKNQSTVQCLFKRRGSSVCTKSYSCVPDEKGYWKISNFTKNFKDAHLSNDSSFPGMDKFLQSNNFHCTIVLMNITNQNFLYIKDTINLLKKSLVLLRINCFLIHCKMVKTGRARPHLSQVNNNNLKKSTVMFSNS